MSSTESNLENLRLYCRPSRIVLLLVGESPPPRKGFFYDATSTEGPLSRNTRKLFEDLFDKQYPARRDFLNDFQSKGCYLVDLFKKRGKTVNDATQQEKAAAVSALRSLILDAKPRNVVSVLKRTSKLVEIATRGAEASVLHHPLPYPTRNSIKEYSSGLRLILSKLEKSE